MAMTQDQWGGDVTRFLDGLPVHPCLAPPPPSICSVCGRLNGHVAGSCKYYPLMYERVRGHTFLEGPVTPSKRDSFEIELDLEEEPEVPDSPEFEFTATEKHVAIAGGPPPKLPDSEEAVDVEVVEVVPEVLEEEEVVEEFEETPSSLPLTPPYRPGQAEPTPPVRTTTVPEIAPPAAPPVTPPAKKLQRVIRKPAAPVQKPEEAPAAPPVIPAAPPVAPAITPPAKKLQRVIKKPAAPLPKPSEAPAVPPTSAPPATEPAVQKKVIKKMAKVMKQPEAPAAPPTAPPVAPSVSRAPQLPPKEPPKPFEPARPLFPPPESRIPPVGPRGPTPSITYKSTSPTTPWKPPSEKEDELPLAKPTTDRPAGQTPVAPSFQARTPPTAPPAVSTPPTQPAGPGAPPFPRRRTGGLYDILRAKPVDGTAPPAEEKPAAPAPVDSKKKEDEELLKKLRGMNP